MSTADPSEGPGHRASAGHMMRDGYVNTSLICDSKSCQQQRRLCDPVQSAELRACCKVQGPSSLLSFYLCFCTCVGLLYIDSGHSVHAATECRRRRESEVSRSPAPLRVFIACLGSSVRVNLSLAFREVNAATSTAVQSARCMSDSRASDVRAEYLTTSLLVLQST